MRLAGVTRMSHDKEQGCKHLSYWLVGGDEVLGRFQVGLGGDKFQ